MSYAAIRIDNISKRYCIGPWSEHLRYRTARDAITGGVAAFLQRFKPGGLAAANEQRSFWALDDVGFEVQAGEVIGIIGRNGAGKSTLLKILSRITEPTRGRIEMRGRVASLLEVGTGFHGELTGQENIFLNGALLGMSRREIQRNLDEIVAFSELGTFIDTPVKRYSSGMYVRLAFAVAAHLQPEILIVDEVLAVGDAAFRQKCMGKMKSVARSGRTILFVSHDASAVRNLCSRAILLHQGRLVCDDRVDRCMRRYESIGPAELGTTWERPAESERRQLSIERISATLGGEQPHHFLDVEVQLASNAWHRPAFLSLTVRDFTGLPVLEALPTIEGFLLPEAGQHTVRLRVTLPPLIPRQYHVAAWVGAHFTETLDWVPECVRFEIACSPTPNRTVPHSPDQGYIVAHSDLEYKSR
jgi:lipopolysaccharide transport system ATP-binding protein